jgi:hypothetical protein
MFVIFFGAGASYGSEIEGRVPPLSPWLFDGLVSYAPATWGALPHSWSDKFRKDFESAMASFIKSGNFGAPLQWDMAEYFYSQFTATAASTYLTLLKAIGDKIDQYLFVTINYDLLLFQARALAGIPVKNLKICLPHGNSCLCCEGISATPGVSFTGGVSTGGTVRIFKNLADLRAEKAKNVFPPIMSYFEPDKFTVSCSDFIADERNQYRLSILEASKVAIIGVKVHPIDKHLWEPLASTKAQLLYLAGSESAGEFSAWCKNVNRSGDIIVPNYFREGLDDLVGFFA